MATTAVFAEILIVGLEAGVWGVLLVFIIFGRAWVHLGSLSGWEGLITIAVVATAYVLGIIVDRAADSFFRWLEPTAIGLSINRRLGARSYWYVAPAPVSEMRLTVMQDGKGMAGFLDYQRTRVRIARATVFNLAIALPITLVYVATRTGSAASSAFAMGALLLAFLVLSLFASERIHGAYIERLSEAYLLLRPKDRQPAVDAANRDPCSSGIKGEVVAAVCYKREGDSVCFLLVTTKGGGRWTFPKGHIDPEKDRSARDTASREALEEAGARGQAKKNPFAHFLFPATNRADGASDYCVAAHLLKVEDLVEPTEPGRQRGWYRPSAAKEVLSGGGREKRYARELKRVVRLAGRELSRDS